MIIQKNTKRVFVVTLGIIYFISFWLLTIGFFSPFWLLVDLSSWEYHYIWWRLVGTDPLWLYDENSCYSIGLVKPTHNCDATIYDKFVHYDILQGMDYVLDKAFILMTTAVTIVYTNAIMIGLAIVFGMLKYSLFTSLLSISFGVCYPIAAILILVATIYIEATYKYKTGFSTMICTIAGGLMLFFYIALIWYDQMYVKKISTTQETKKKAHQETTERGSRQLNKTISKLRAGRRDLTKLNSDAEIVKTSHTSKNETRRTWGLRRI